MVQIARRLRPDPLALLLASVVTVVSLVLNRTIFEAVPHTEDEVAFLFQAATIARGHLVAPAPPIPDAFAIPFVIVHDGLWFGKYPPGYPLVLSLGVLLGYPALVNALSAGLSVLLVTILAQRLYGDRSTGLLAAVLLASSPFFLLQSASFMAHTVCLLLTLVFMLSFATTLQTTQILRALPGAVAIALLVLARPLTALGVLLPFMVWSLWRFWRQPDWRAVASIYATGGCLGAAALLAYNRLTTGDPLVFGYELWWPFDRVGFGPGISPDGQHTVTEGLFNTRFNIRHLEEVLFGWPGRLDLAPAALATLVAAARLALHSALERVPGRGLPRDNVWDLVFAAQVCSLIGLHTAYWAAGQMYGPRYYFEALAALVLLSARGLRFVALGARWLWQVVTLRDELPARLVWGGVLALLALVLWGVFATGVPWWQSYRWWYDIHAEPARTIATQAPPNSVVLVPVPYWTEYAPYFVRNSPLLDSPVLYAHDLGPRSAELFAAFPDRQFYRVSGNSLVPVWNAIAAPPNRDP